MLKTDMYSTNHRPSRFSSYRDKHLINKTDSAEPLSLKPISKKTRLSNKENNYPKSIKLLPNNLLKQSIKNRKALGFSNTLEKTLNLGFQLSKFILEQSTVKSAKENSRSAKKRSYLSLDNANSEIKSFSSTEEEEKNAQENYFKDLSPIFYSKHSIENSNDSSVLLNLFKCEPVNPQEVVNFNLALDKSVASTNKHVDSEFWLKVDRVNDKTSRDISTEFSIEIQGDEEKSTENSSHRLNNMILIGLSEDD